MVILGGLEIVAAGYLLKELHGDSKEEERQRERRRRRRRDSHDRPHRHDSSNSPPHRPSRPPQQSLYPPAQQPGRPYSAPPPQNRPQMLPVAMAAAAAQQWQHQSRPMGPPMQQQTWPQGPPQQQQQQPRPPPQQYNSLPPPQTGGGNFAPPPRTNTNYPPPGVHIDLKTGKIQHDMLPPEMPRKGEARSYYEGDRPPPPQQPPNQQPNAPRGDSYERRRENSLPQQRPVAFPTPYTPENGEHSYSQPVIALSPPMGYAELDSETPGRYGAQRGYGREKSHSFSHGYEDGDGGRSPPPAYREY
jgi:hypothetical protein